MYPVGGTNLHTHGFEKDGLIVDITADQFADAPCAVLVTKDSSWHGQFMAEQCLPVEDMRALPEIERQLHDTYRIISVHISVMGRVKPATCGRVETGH